MDYMDKEKNPQAKKNAKHNTNKGNKNDAFSQMIFLGDPKI